jgi:hypothetical protein
MNGSNMVQRLVVVKLDWVLVAGPLSLVAGGWSPVPGCELRVAWRKADQSEAPNLQSEFRNRVPNFTPRNTYPVARNS